jgi:hypothetical protein
MPQDPNPPSAVDQAVSRALRENLERIQRTSDELHQAVSDVVAACASSRPSHALSSMLRAQTAAASISAVLDVMSRFVSSSVQGSPRSPFEAEMARIASTVAPESAPPIGVHQAVPAAPPHREPAGVAPQHRSPAPPLPVRDLHIEPAIEQNFEDDAALPSAVVAEPDYPQEFDVNRLSPEEQELHRRANRVAKVSMQDIKMLRPEQVRLGRENNDLCIRLRDDIEKAHREYDRRFKPIMDHPVDYFYRWLVEILAEGDAHALGEYPYATTARQH